MPPTLEHRCTSCGALQSSTTRTKASIGRPFATCGSCGGFVPRRPFEEWASMAPSSRAQLVLGELALALCVGLAPAVLLGLWGIVTSTGSERSRLLVVAAAGLALALSVWGLSLSRRIRESTRRMGDPMYRAKLAKFAMVAASDGEGGAGS